MTLEIGDKVWFKPRHTNFMVEVSITNITVTQDEEDSENEIPLFWIDEPLEFGLEEEEFIRSRTEAENTLLLFKQVEKAFWHEEGFFSFFDPMAQSTMQPRITNLELWREENFRRIAQKKCRKFVNNDDYEAILQNTIKELRVKCKEKKYEQEWFN